MTLKCDGWLRKSIEHLFHNTSSFLHHSKAIGEFKLELQSRNAQFGSKLAIIFVPCDLEIWRMTFKSIRASLLYIKLCVSFQSHLWIQTRVTIRKHSIRIKISIFCPVWPINLMGDLENNRSPILCYFTLCASFQSHLWIQTGVTVPKRLNWGLTSVTLTFDLDLCHGHHFSPCQ